MGHSRVLFLLSLQITELPLVLEGRDHTVRVMIVTFSPALPSDVKGGSNEHRLFISSVPSLLSAPCLCPRVSICLFRFSWLNAFLLCSLLPSFVPSFVSSLPLTIVSYSPPFRLFIHYFLSPSFVLASSSHPSLLVSILRLYTVLSTSTCCPFPS